MRLRYVLPLLLLPIQANATEVDLEAVMLGQDGKPKQECIRLSLDRAKCEEEIAVTLRWLSKFALDLPEDKLAYSEIVKRGKLAEKLALSGNRIDLSIEEARLLKDQITKTPVSPLIRFQALSLIDPTGVKDAK